MPNIEHKLGKQYINHKVFETLKLFWELYDSLSFHVMGFISSGAGAVINIDTYAFTSMQGTLESIHDILKKGRINDAYALVRKYHDSILINVYCNVYLKENFSLEKFIVKQIRNWLDGIEQIPTNRIINTYIEKSETVKTIYQILKRDNTYNDIKERCNDHVHYNYYKNVLLNDNQIYSINRLTELDQIDQDIRDLLILHFAYTFFLNGHYMMASDYIDHLDIGAPPPEDSEYWVAPEVQNLFDTIIKPRKPDIAEAIKENTSMWLK